MKNVIVAPELVALIDRVTWEIESDGTQWRFIPLYAPGEDPHDLAEMLEAFFRTDAKDGDAVGNFLRTYGDFYPPSRTLTLLSFAEWQQKLLHMRLHAPSRWEQCLPIAPLQNLAFLMEWSGNTPKWRLEAKGCLHAMAAVIHLDHAKGLRFGQCASPSCRRIFPKLTKHRSRFCNRTCQHRDVVRRAEAKARKRARGTKRRG